MSITYETVGGQDPDQCKDCVVIPAEFMAGLYETYASFRPGEPVYVCDENNTYIKERQKRRQSHISLDHTTPCCRKTTNSNLLGIAITGFTSPFEAWLHPEHALISVAIAGKICTHVEGVNIESHIGTPVYAVTHPIRNRLSIKANGNQQRIQVGIIITWRGGDTADIFIQFSE